MSAPKGKTYGTHARNGCFPRRESKLKATDVQYQPKLGIVPRRPICLNQRPPNGTCHLRVGHDMGEKQRNWAWPVRKRSSLATRPNKADLKRVSWCGSSSFHPIP